MEDEKYQVETRMLLNQLKDFAKEKGITEQQIADKTGFIQSNVNRMFAGKYSPLLDNFIQLADAIGYHIVLKENHDSSR
jgi:transcriptional regulator with XRE-family HTH domain